eukprot:GILJ01009598.1.p1 GENE.GILJ01009598.1~~GILJ01009598.1.p1  ORF type:complete len:1135 (+),score=165.01 GILJ01009598.1:128-3532(+)
MFTEIWSFVIASTWLQLSVAVTAVTIIITVIIQASARRGHREARYYRNPDLDGLDDVDEYSESEEEDKMEDDEPSSEALITPKLPLDSQTPSFQKKVMSRVDLVGLLQGDEVSSSVDARSSIKLFRYLEEPVVKELCRLLEKVELEAGETLFEEDTGCCCLYIVTSGKLQLTVKTQDNIERPLTEIIAGESVTSLLSLLEVMTGEECYWDATARAVTHVELVKLSPANIRRLVSIFPTDMANVVRLLIVRLQRVMFLTLYQYFGLSREMMVTDKVVIKNNVKDFFENRGTHRMDGKDQTSLAVEYIATALNIAAERPSRKTIDIIKSGTGFQEVRAGSNLFRVGDHNEKIFVLISGRMEVSLPPPRTGSAEPIPPTLNRRTSTHAPRDTNALYEMVPGETVGHLSVLTGDPSPVGVTAITDCQVVYLTKSAFDQLATEEPSVVLNVTRFIMQRLSKLVRQLDHALEWTHIKAGHTLYREGDLSDCLYVVLSGRLLHTIKRADNRSEVVGQAIRGDCLGELGVLTGEPRETKLGAIRDSELCKISKSVVLLIAQRYPSVMLSFAKTIGLKLQRQWVGLPMNASDGRFGATTPAHHLKLPAALLDTRSPKTAGNNNPFAQPLNHARRRVDLATVAILPAGGFVPLADFSKRLLTALQSIGPIHHLNSDIIQHMGFSRRGGKMGELKMTHWLGELEEKNRIVLYEADPTPTDWTLQCIRQADCILIVGCAENEPVLGAVEQELAKIGRKHTRKELVILHRGGLEMSSTTRTWLRLRDKIVRHHHIRLERPSDWERLARLITGTAVGLVLGGGGARGLAHLGVIRALHEAGIPIDMVGGTSIGSFVGGLYAMTSSSSYGLMMSKARRFSLHMSSTWRLIRDLTIPFTAYFSGRGFNRGLRKIFGRSRIEDLWLNYFCVTTNISNSSQMVHREGQLWRYCRASMTLAGFLPPLCDDGSLLVDGGYVNNLPSDVMHSMGAGTVLLVDVGARFDAQLTDYGDSLSGTWLLLRKLNPFASPLKIPSLSEIQARLAYITTDARSLAIEQTVDLYLSPPVQQYGTLEFGKFDEIVKVGYDYARNMLDQWKQEPGAEPLLKIIPRSTLRQELLAFAMVRAEADDIGKLGNCNRRKKAPVRKLSED